jgi:hypothetical protein
MIENIHVGDIALIEILAEGRTDAPREIMDELRRRGHLDRKGRLTAAGRRRARALKDSEASLRHQFAGGDGGGANAMLKTVGRPRLILTGGGPVTIRT